MRKATKIVASLFGIVAGLAGFEHGYFEILQGNAKPASLMIPSIGPPCVPEKVWNGCEPAMTIVPSFLVTGILAIIISLAILIWAGAFIQRKNGGVILILLSIALLLFGGGIFPPLIGFVGGVAGTKINAPLSKRPAGRILRFFAKCWPWLFVIFMIWVIGQFIVGYFFNDFMMKNGFLNLIVIVVLLPLSITAANAHDIQNRDRTAAQRAS